MRVVEQLCPKHRGGTFDFRASSTWESLGEWQLSFPYADAKANGNYGLDNLVARDSQSDTLVSLDKALITTFTSPDYYNGFFGLGIVSGQFNGQVSDSPFSQMVADYGWFPSYTYGYTAGAYYSMESQGYLFPFNHGHSTNMYTEGSGTPSSLVLGGYDKNRFSSHDTEFTLTRNTSLPQAQVRGIEVSAPEGDTPKGWDSNVRVLSGMDDSFEAIIDSSTPYLWLPESVCDKFVTAFKLTWNKTLDAYEMDDDQFKTLKADKSFSFTFSLSSYDNNDNFGNPLDAPGVVNITLSAHAFAQILQYPYNGMEYQEAAHPYFPIKPSNDNNFILGRTFLQEAYLITKYDSTVFSVHQALFPEDGLKTDIATVEQPPNSAYPPPADKGDGSGLSKSQLIGVVIGVVLGAVIALSVFFFYIRRRKKARMGKMFPDHDAKDSASSIITETPMTPVARIFSKIIRRKRSKKNESADASGTDGSPAEVGADATHEVYEMPAPPSPVELDADTDSVVSDTELRTGGEENVNAYEAARRKMERRLQGPVPAYSPPSNDAAALAGDGPDGDKSVQDVSPLETYRPTDRVSPASSPTEANSDSLPHSLPSPMSPRTADWGPRSFDLPSPMTVNISFPSPTYPNGTGPPPSVSSRSQTYSSSLSRSSSSNAPSPTSATSTHSGAIQRTPIDPSRIICLGPLPENVQLPNSGPVHPVIPQRSQSGPETPVMGNPEAQVSTETLGSNFTDMEEQMARAQSSPRSRRERGQDVSESPRSGTNNLASPRSLDRIDGGVELIHVPQLAERRYSWEEER